ncbi:MAG TPA: isoprenylcysteine carboxylmethyltransferase family protein [Vicinamibacterales bacterium]|jgi:protein-S-isoprenylcysteine O-methyltransferase Ste14
MRQLNVSIAWTGTLLFAASLVWFLYCYLVRFGDPVPGPVLLDAIAGPIAIDVVLFSVFAVHHSLLARPSFKRYVHRIAPPELERSIYTWTSSLLFIIVCTWWQPVAGVLYRLEGGWRIAGYAVQLIGFALTVRASSKLDVLDLSGVRAVLRRNRDRDATEHVPLETRGLYGFVRHPLYFAWTCFVFGAPDMTATRALFALVSTGYLAIAIPFEERGLIQAFGAEYEAYRRKVRWRLIPGIY